MKKMILIGVAVLATVSAIAFTVNACCDGCPMCPPDSCPAGMCCKK